MPPVNSSKILLTFLSLAIFMLQHPAAAGAQPSAADGSFKFLLSAAAKVVRDGRPRVVPLADGMALQSGNLIKFYVELEKEGYFYLFHEDSRGELALLYPKEPDRTEVRAHTPVYVPEGSGWIELDANPGRETFHLLVSAARLVRLENLCATHRTLEEKAAVEHSSQSILAEIRSAARGSLARQAEKPSRIAGKLRGGPGAGAAAPAELFKSAVEVATSGRYLKTITIIHD